MLWKQRQPKVGELADAGAHQQQVGRLHVAVHDAMRRVQVVEALAGVQRHRTRGGLCHAAVRVDAALERARISELEAEVQGTVVKEDVDELKDVSVPHAPQQRELAHREVARGPPPTGGADTAAEAAAVHRELLERIRAPTPHVAP